jgi:RHS repeat-associated protein
VRKVVNSDTTRYVLENGQVIIELDNTWQPTKYTYYPGTDQPSSMVRAGKRYYFLQDAQRNVVAVLDSAGTINNTYKYTPYGEAIATTEAVTNPFRYKGRDWDAEARLYFMRARFYDPLLGRFISDDPIGLAGGIIRPHSSAASRSIGAILRATSVSLPLMPSSGGRMEASPSEPGSRHATTLTAEVQHLASRGPNSAG